MSVFYPLKAKKIIRESAGAVSIQLDISEELKAVFDYKQGQYITVRSTIGGNEIRRSYSMSSSPLEEALQFTVKPIKNGKMSNYLCNVVKEGDLLEIMPPEGRFYVKLHPEHRKKYIMICAGSGITPIMSILKTTLEVEPLSEIQLIYGNRNEESVLFREILDGLSERYSGQLTIEYVYSGESIEGKGIFGKLFGSTPSKPLTSKKGRISANVLSACFIENPPGENAEFLICGPGDMILIVQSFLLSQGFKPEQIHKEFFTNPDLKENKAQAVALPNKGTVPAQVRLNGQEYNLELQTNKTILEALIDLKLDPPYSCSSGSCSTCMAKKTSGEVKMDSCLALDESEVEEGYILTCQARIISDSIELTYDI